MKRHLLISASCAALALGACGGDDDSGGAGGKGGSDAGTGASGGSGGSGGVTNGGTGGVTNGGSGGAGGVTGGAGGVTGGAGGVTGGGTGGVAGGGTGGVAGGGTGGVAGGGGTGATGGAAGGGGTGGTPNLSLNCAASVGTAPSLKLTSYQTGYSSPVIVEAPTGDARLFVGEQGGVIRLIKGGAKVATPFMDISGRVQSGGEQGLLGLAFHPNFATNGKFYTHYTGDGTTAPSDDTVISEFTTSSADIGNPASEVVLLTQVQPYDNHNGGAIHFRNDGMLYIGLGDGGSGGDPQNNGQTLSTLLGKMLRINVNATSPGKAYAIPSGNMTGGGALPELWSYGLRNPWRWSFDGCTWDMYIGDVGQNQIEEVDVEAVSAGSGTNWGWRVMEGNQCFNPATGCNMSGKALPVSQYTHSNGCSITGGYVYRGSAIPGLRGTYIYADYCSGRFWSFKWTGGSVTTTQITSTINPGQAVTNITTFGQDASGEMYIAAGGSIYRIDAQ